ncbi:hypothetical protein RFI_22040, partial [Reticulomyxa filosa]
FISVSADRSAILWTRDGVDNDRNSNSPAYKVKCQWNNLHNDPIYHCDWLRSSKMLANNWVAFCSGDNSFQIWSDFDNAKWKNYITFSNAHEEDINWIEFGPQIVTTDSKQVVIFATASDDGLIKLWKMVVDATPTSPSDHPHTDSSVSVSAGFDEQDIMDID